MVVEEEAPGYRLIAGERRLRALRIGRETGRAHPHFRAAPALVFPGPVAEATRRLFQLAENLARRDLRPGEVARGLAAARLALEIERGLQAVRAAGVPLEGMPTDPEPLRGELLRRLEQAGLEPPRVAWREVLERVGLRMDPARRKAYLRLLKLPEDVLEAVDEGGLSAHAANQLARLGSAEAQRELLAAAARCGAPRAVARAAAAIQEDPALTPGEALERALAAHRAADASRQASLRAAREGALQEEAVEAFARSAKALCRHLEHALPTPYQAGTIRLLCQEVLAALP
jgi:ParB family chromosome partitioning protein